MFRRTKTATVPEIGSKAPEFNLPSAQGGQLRLSMRTVQGPVVVVFYRPWSKEDAAYFKELSSKEDEINLAAASIVGIGIARPDEARDCVRESGIKSYVLYDYVKVTTREWGLLGKDGEHGEYSRPAVFIVGTDHVVAHAWTDERPSADEILAKVSEITGLPKPAEEGEEGQKPKRPKKADKAGDSAGPSGEPAREKLSPEEREKRRAARESGERPASVEKGSSGRGEKPGVESEKPSAETGSEPGEKGGSAELPEPVEEEEKTAGKEE